MQSALLERLQDAVEGSIARTTESSYAVYGQRQRI